MAVLGKNRIFPKDTYLAGGSALALHFGHRISIDFDFFTQRNFRGKELTEKLKQIGTFEFQEAAEKNILLGLFNQVKFSLFQYDYALLFKPVPYFGTKLAHPKDIAAMKIAAVMDRGTKKDFIDLYFLNKNNISLASAFHYYDKKYKFLANNLYSILKSLTYFEEADSSDMPEMIKKISWDEVKDFLRKETIRLTKKYI